MNRNLLSYPSSKPGGCCGPRKISPVDLVDAALARIERLNPRLNAFLTITADSAQRAARQAEKELRKGRDRGPLHGIPDFFEG